MKRTKNLSSQWMLMMVGLLAFVLVAGCGGGDDEVQTDPNLMNPPETDIPPTEIPRDPFPSTDPEPVEVENEPVEHVMLKDVFFDFDQYDLDADARSVLAENGHSLRDSGAQITIEGHCDERGTVQYNLALGEKRAKEARDYLVSLGIDASRIDVVSYGKERPFVMGSGESAWSQNRRAHFVVQ